MPGRWSSQDDKEITRKEDLEDTAAADADDEEDDDGSEKLSKEQELLQYAKQMDDDGVPDPIRRKILAERENMHATGVKGVLADYKTHLKMEQARQEAEKVERARIIDRMVNGSRVSNQSMTNENDAFLLLESALTSSQTMKSLPHEPETLDDDDDDLLGDDEFLTIFRQQRMRGI